MNRYEIRLSGAGGQGLILAGIILAEGVILEGGYNVVQTQSYGPEARGGASKAEVVISPSIIYFPKVTNPDLLLTLTQKAYDKYVKDLKPNGILIADEEIDTEDLPSTIEVYRLPILRTAREELGKSLVANIISLGVICGCLDFISSEKLKEAVLARVPKGTEELNTKAFELGLRMQKEAKK
ncbi:2-oxoglutarate ferredoxin oxidoreductase subunit gamma [Anoxybacter fermentans]|uniref:2-oxoglutarate ferredoxin oxidoreductase subunit gamma n=1 Tax=Anoxybacter fermentans TaxID=1323375 RepID=A0A3Q9HPK2_9FIRM|nr:2-oxoacid:acceptor oxidoreductase family protein [Anoxybacter fermentans]AZR72815.1 2-oxoglutarate ferredoxin oxidoreductase subunit gamma [Anoxybacter fermentans]